MAFTALQIIGLVLIVASLAWMLGIPGALLGVGGAAVYVGLAGEGS